MEPSCIHEFQFSEGASARAPTGGEETATGRAADWRPPDDPGQEQVQSCVTGVPEARAEHPGGVCRRQHGLQANHQRGDDEAPTGLVALEGWGGRSRSKEHERKPRRNKIIQRRHCRHCSECSSLMNNSKTRMSCFSRVVL